MLAGVLLLLPGCQARPRPAGHPENQGEAAPAPAVGFTFVFECPDDYDFVVRLKGDTAWLFLPGQTVALPRMRTASGTKYSDAGITFWSRGEEARLELGDTTIHSCQNNRAQALWEDAKLRGVSFRAVGQEPGWHLEITDGQQIRLVTAYGAQPYTFPTPVPVVNQASATTRYVTEHSGHELLVLIEGKRCYDTMSGEAFAVTVTLRLDGREYRGCGRPLH
jgi:uncharacterized membrane protein